MYVRHVNQLTVSNLIITKVESDERSPILLQDVENSHFEAVNAQHESGQAVFVLRNVKALESRDCDDVKNQKLASAIQTSL
jgi:hypothetical protein